MRTSQGPISTSTTSGQHGTATLPIEAPVVLDAEGKPIGTYLRSVDTKDGAMLLIDRCESLGGGTIVVPAREATKRADTWELAFGELSIREAPQFSPNVDLHAYFAFWERLGARNDNMSAAEYMPTGGGPVSSDISVSNDALQEAVTAALEDARGNVDYHLVRTRVNRGTVLLEGYALDTPERLAVSEIVAKVPGVREIVNMLVIRGQ